MLAGRSGSTVTVVGCLDRVPPRRGWDTVERTSAIGAAVLCDGELRGVYHKVLLPTYDVFSEARTFAAGDKPGALWRIGGVVAGISICEDLWSGDGPPELQAATGAQILLVPNGSPYYRDKRHSRRETAAGGRQAQRRAGGLRELRRRSRRPGLRRRLDRRRRRRRDPLPRPAVRGRALLPGRAGGRAAPAHRRTADDRPRADPAGTRGRRRRPEPPPTYEPLDEIWRVLAIGVRDFAHKNGFRKAILGLSGGIDSAVTATVAVDALGPECVIAVAMPAPDEEGAEEELATARQLASVLGIELEERPLRGVAPELEGAADQVAEAPEGDALEELRARARGAVLRTMAEALDAMVLATGNKSELSVGAGVLGGDMSGDFSPLRDCPKTLLYDLVRWRNRFGEQDDLPSDILDRTPSVRSREELSLPSYRVLDEIVERFIEYGDGVEELVEAGFDEQTVQDVLRLVIEGERKRRQVSPGVKITARAWGKDLHMPVTNGWRPFDRKEQAWSDAS